MYTNGALVSSVNYTFCGAYGGTMGLGGSSSNVLNGVLDEWRVSNAARSSDWVATEYRNQSTPSTFYSVAAPEIGAVLQSRGN